MSTGPEIVKKGAELVEKHELGVDSLANLAYSLRSERLQGMFNWFTENTEEGERDMLRADDRTFVMKFIEKWVPGMDYKGLNKGRDAMRTVFSILACYGALDVKPEILKDMRGMAGTGILSVPGPVLEFALTLLGIPEAYPLLAAAKAIGNANDSISEKVRTKVMEKVEAHKVEDTQKVEHDAEIHAAGMDQVKNAA